MSDKPIEKPMLFSAPMILALLAGRKTMTRRIVKPQPEFQGKECFGDSWKWSIGHAGLLYRDRCPHPVGSRIWAKETIWVDRREPDNCVIYAATPELCKYRNGFVQSCDPNIDTEYLEKHEFWNRKPSIFMPRWASRITLEVTEVRVQRLQEISAEDIISEGAVERPHEDPHLGRCPVSAFDGVCYPDLKSLWAHGWEKINGRGSWSENPYVWCYSFRKL